MAKKVLTVSIIGLGNIGLLYDLNKKNNSKEYLTHTRSAYFHESFDIKFLVDEDVKKIELAKSKYGNEISYMTEIDESFTPTDIVVLSCHPNINRRYLNFLKSFDEIKLFVIEKPFFNRASDIDLFKNIIHKTYINYFRKSLPFFKELRQNIYQVSYGNLILINVYYSKGLKNNGSHLIDLINFLLGPTFITNSVQVFNYINDYNKNDLSVSFSINYEYNFKECGVVFQALDERVFSLIELDLIFEKQRFRIFDFGGKIQVYKVEKDKVFNDYKNLIPYSEIDSNIDSYGLYTYDTIYGIVEKDQQNFSSIMEEYNVFRINEAVNNCLNKKIKNE